MPTKNPDITVQLYAAGASGGNRGAAAASPSGGKQLMNEDDLRAVQTTIVQVISGFAPPAQPPQDERMGLDEVEIELGFQLEGAPGKIWRITFIDAKASASIRAVLTWRRNK